jgi:hypothetical protein
MIATAMPVILRFETTYSFVTLPINRLSMATFPTHFAYPKLLLHLQYICEGKVNCF